MRFSSSFKYLLAISQIIAPSAKAIGLDTTEKFLPSTPIVLTPTHLRQPLTDVPASVTVITAKMLKQFGITSVPKALRLTPGSACPFHRST